MSTKTRAIARIWACLGAIAMAGCLNNEGLTPPTHELNFPASIATVDLVTDAVDAPTHLLVVNTNFDLKYSGSTMLSIDLANANDALDDCVQTGIDQGLPGDCAVVSDVAQSSRDVDPGSLRVVERGDLVSGEVVIGSFAEALIVVRSAVGHTAYIAVGSTASITHVELEEGGALSCGQGANRECASGHTTINDAALAARDDLDLPLEPTDLVVGDLTAFGRPAEEGRYIVLLHRQGQATFLTHGAVGTPPEVVDVLEGLGTQLSSVMRDPATGLFFATSGRSNSIARLGVALDGVTGSASNTRLFASTPLVLGGLNTSNANIRQVIPDPRTTAPFAGRLYAVAASPQALLVGRAAADGQLDLEHVIDLGEQPSRATLLQIGGRLVIAVSCFSSRDLYFIDADLSRVVGVIRGFSGAYDLAYDPLRERLYVSDYRVSVIRVVDLAPLFDCVLDRTSATTCSPRLLGMLGIPNAVQQL